MSVEVVMPQMGESITEGTVSKWMKAVGERIEKDEPLLEISTDKVDAEVPAPGAGVLLEIKAAEGETVEVGSVVGVIGEEGESPVSSAPPAASKQSEPPKSDIKEAAEEELEETKDEPVEKQIEAVNAAVASAEEITPSADSSDAAEIVMPQMGESITEGTVSKWLKEVGDTIEKDEPLLEISTDKVDAEVPSPVGGKLLAINVNEGETVEVGAVVGLVGAEGASPVGSRQSAAGSKSVSAVEEKSSAASAGSLSSGVSMPAAEKREIEETEGRSYDYQRPDAKDDAQGNGKSNGELSLEELRRTKSSPLVRNIAKEHGY